ncbi:MAG TPA: SGNH/GDSL hydrolase family protein [Ktedonobacterales bacterium]
MAASAGSRMGRVAFYGLGFAVLTVGLILVNFLVLSANPVHETPHYYLALGDSLSFGYQPTFNFGEGFVDDVYAQQAAAGITSVTNYACPGETTATMISGKCPFKELRHQQYTGSQLDVAIQFLNAHPERVNPVTLEIGSNDVLPDFDVSTCTAGPSADADLAIMDANLTETILPQLTYAMQSPSGGRTGEIHLLNYYDPYAQACPNSLNYVKTLNTHLAADAASFNISMIDVYTAFGGDQSQADHVCNTDPTVAYTWFCVPQNSDIHPTSKGYSIIATAIINTLGLPGSSKAPIFTNQTSLPTSITWLRPRGFAHT